VVFATVTAFVKPERVSESRKDKRDEKDSPVNQEVMELEGIPGFAGIGHPGSLRHSSLCNQPAKRLQ
jgi:hypothetical protein